MTCFFFQAEDGIRDLTVTGVQTCALPISLDLRLDEVAPDVHQLAVLHARGARRLAGAAREAAIQMKLRAAGDRRALEHLLHEVDAATRAVELVAEKRVGGAGGEAEAAMHALAKNRRGLDSRRGVANHG